MAGSIYAADQTMPAEQKHSFFDNIGKTRDELLETEGAYEYSTWFELSQTDRYEEMGFSQRVIMGHIYRPVYVIENGSVVSSAYFLTKNQILWEEIKTYTTLLEKNIKDKLTNPKRVESGQAGNYKFSRSCMLVDTRYNVLISVLSKKEKNATSAFIMISDRKATGSFIQRENTYFDLRIKAGTFEMDNDSSTLNVN